MEDRDMCETGLFEAHDRIKILQKEILSLANTYRDNDKAYESKFNRLNNELSLQKKKTRRTRWIAAGGTVAGFIAGIITIVTR